jgi:predicted RNA-binding protein with RPS1 domain
LLKLGEEVDVYVLGINQAEKKIALSIKRTQAEPWSRVASSYEVVQLVRGTVTQLANFGAFARIEDGIEGLIHVSELADERIQHPKQVVQEGQDLLLRIIRIDPQRRRMGLSLRRALDTPDTELVEAFGEDVLPERDALVQRIRESLDAEGLTGTSQDDPEPAEEGGETSQAASATTEAPITESSTPSQVAAFEERQQRAEEAAARERAPRAQRQPRQQGQDDRSRVDSDENLSAMALAFAQAGIDDEVPVAPAVTEPASKPAPVEAVAEVAVEPVVEAEAAAEVEAEPVVETEAETAAEAEPVVEAEAIAEVETAPVVEAEAETTVETEPVVETEAEAVVETEAEAVAETEPEAKPEAATSGKELGPADREGTDWVAGDGTPNIPEGFPIKGNASSRIFHPVESPSYERTTAEVYFANAEAAESAGYRLPKSMQQTGAAAANAVSDLAEAATKDDE